MILAILQARMGSTRLPGKVLMPLCGKPMLQHQLERVGRSQRLDRIVVATTSQASDDPIAELCGSLNVGCYRGSEADVLERYYQAAIAHDPGHVVRLTGDCPLSDPTLIDEVVARHLERDADYSSNCLERSYPDGLDVEIMRMSVLEAAWSEARLASQREHVTAFITQQPQRFRLVSVTADSNHADLRWAVDEAVDYELVKRIYDALYPDNPRFSTADILAVLRAHPDWSALNSHIETNAGLEKSLASDELLPERRQ